MALIDDYDALVCDLDGVVYRGRAAVAGAVQALGRSAVPVVYATNNASRTPQDVAAHLRELGLNAGPEDVLTSAQAGAHHLLGVLPAGAQVLAVGGAGVLEALRANGFRAVPASKARVSADSSEPEHVAGVLQGYGADLTAADLAEAAYAVQSGALWVVTNTDATLPTERGTAPGNGTLVDAVERAVGRPPDVVVGKPHAPLYLLCAQRVSAAPDRVLAVGDRLDTDIAGAVAAGMDSALVLTGVDTVGSLAAAPAGLRPTYLLADLEGLHTAYEAACRLDSWWACGPDRRRIAGDRWEVASEGSPLQRARAGVAAIHEAREGGRLDEHGAARLVSQLEPAQ